MGEKKIILCVDDDPDDRQLLKDVISKSNPQKYEFAEVENGRDVWLFLRSEKCCLNKILLIILDLNMPFENGRQTLTKLKIDPDTAQIPVVVFTTSNSSTDIEFCRRLHIDMITKPMIYEELQALVPRLLRNSL